MNGRFYVQGAVVLMAVCSLIFSVFVGKRQINQKIEKDVQINITMNCNEDTLNVDNVKNFIKRCKFEHPDILFAQVMLESGNLKSEVATQNNNLLGMRMPGQRPTTAIGKQNGYAIYTSWKECLLDYMIWQSRYAKGLNVDEYLNVLQSVYASDKNYVKKLKEIINGGI